MRRNKTLALAVSTTLGLAAVGLSPTVASAQELQEIVVTGSRIATTDGFSQVAPVTVVGAADIKNTGMTRLEDVLNSLPSVETSNSSFDSNGATGTASLDLRGMGTNRTLVLFNGKRLQPGGIWSQAPDVNQIPAAIVERVEVLTGGASATYGADAVAGVVNFITRRINGIEVSVGANGYQHDNSNGYIQGLMDDQNFSYPKGNTSIDGRSYNIDVLMGTDFADGRGNATVYGTWRKGDGLLEGKRDYASCALNNGGTRCGGSANSPVPNFFIAPLTATGQGPTDPNTGLSYDYDQEGFYTLQSDNSLADFTDNYYNYAPVNYFMRPDEKYSLGAFVDYEVNSHFHPYMEVNFNSSNTRGQIAESGTFFADTYFLPVDYALFPAAFQASLATLYPGATDVGVYIGKRNVEGGPRSDILGYDSFRMVGGSRGEINDKWTYDVSYLKGVTHSSSTYINDLYLPAIANAIYPGCDTTPGGCYQVFTYGGVTQAQAAALSGTAIMVGTTSTEVMNGYVSGDLGVGFPGADPIQAVFGVEHRSERYSRTPDTTYQAGALAGQGSATLPINGGYNVMEYFTEFSVPLLQDMPFAQSLTADLAYRYSDYSTAGTTDTYRIGADWQPVDLFRVRAGYNRAVRAPNVAELYAPNNVGLWNGSDPCAGVVDSDPTTVSPVYTAAQCANTGVTASQYGNILPSPASQYYQMTGGNAGLKTEKADTITFGVVVDPLPGLTFSIDYWNIKVDDTISTLGSPLILAQCAEFGNFCDKIHRLPNGSLWQGGPSGGAFVENTSANFGKLDYEGIDLAGAYRFDALQGSWTIQMVGTYMLTKKTEPIPGDSNATYDCVGLINPDCYPSPEWRHTMTFGYDSNEWWAVGAKWRFINSIKYDGTLDKIANKTLGAYNYIDLNATFRFMENSDVVVGVNNVFDKEPPLLGAALSGPFGNANMVPFWDPLGRYLFVSATMRF